MPTKEKDNEASGQNSRTWRELVGFTSDPQGPSLRSGETSQPELDDLVKVLMTQTMGLEQDMSLKCPQDAAYQRGKERLDEINKHQLRLRDPQGVLSAKTYATFIKEYVTKDPTLWLGPDRKSLHQLSARTYLPLARQLVEIGETNDPTQNGCDNDLRVCCMLACLAGELKIMTTPEKHCAKKTFYRFYIQPIIEAELIRIRPIIEAELHNPTQPADVDARRFIRTLCLHLAAKFDDGRLHHKVKVRIDEADRSPTSTQMRI